MADSSKKETFVSLLGYSTLGIEMGVSLAIGIAMGYFLDIYFKTKPLLTIIFMIFGIIAGMRRLYQIWKKMEKDETEHDKRD
jgi:ATP synthase protein I